MTTARTILASSVSFTVWGRAQQRGSKTPWIPRRKDGSPVEKNGRIVIATMDSNKKSGDWMRQVRDAAAEAMRGRETFAGPIKLCVHFWFSRPQSHFGAGKNAGKLKSSAPCYFVQSPDIDKLVRCIADGMTGLVYRDDKQICDVYARKEWTTSQERAEITVEIIT